MSTSTDDVKSVDDIIKLYEDYGDRDYIGEAVTQAEHGIQAALCAESEGYGDEEICGALLHDIGHLLGMKFGGHPRMAEFGVAGHENIGAELLRRLHFKEKVCELVRNHVNAKRFLVATDSKYYDSLSEASKNTLKYQGGKMSDEEVKRFKEQSTWQLCLKMRTWDEKAKVQNMKIPPFASYRDLMLRCIEA